MTTTNCTGIKEPNNVIICKSILSDSFLLYLIKEISKPEKVNPYEHQYLKNNKKFKLTKHVAIVTYLGLQRLLNRNKIPKWRHYSNEISKQDRHNGYRHLIAKLTYQIIITLCNKDDTLDDTSINTMYDDIASVHYKSLLQNTKTRKAYLKEDYIIGESNIDFNTKEALKHFETFQIMSKRNGLSNDQKPFKQLKFSIDIQLLLKQKRQKCGYCGKKSHLYCPFCKVPFAIDEQKENDKKYIQLPSLILPIKVDIIRHPKESVNMCSSVHGCIVAPNYVRMYEFPSVPSLSAENGVYLLYPSEKSVFLDEMDLCKVNKIVVIESRWKGNKLIYQHDELRNLPHCKIRNRKTLYWRYQEKSTEYLATIEAIYYGVVDCWIAKNKNKEYNGEYDDLLMLFAHDHHKIRNTNNDMSFWSV